MSEQGKTEVRCTPIVVALLALGLSACGNDGGVGAGAGGGIASVGTATERAATVNLLVASLGQIRSVAGTGGTAKNFENGQCDQGSRMADSESGKSVGSPYSEQGFDVAGEAFSACRLNADFDNSGSADDYLEFDGRSEAGSVEEAEGIVSYVRIGANSDTPLGITIHLESEQGGVMINQDFAYNITLLSHGLASSQDSEQQLFMRLQGGISQGAGSFDFESLLGTSEDSAERFAISNRSDGLRIDGSYSLNFTPEIPNTQCSGTTTVTTDVPLVADGAGYSAGQFSLDSNGDTATVIFNDDSTVSVTVDGSTETIDQSEFRAAAGPCAGFVLAGFGFVNAAGR